MWSFGDLVLVRGYGCERGLCIKEECDDREGEELFLNKFGLLYVYLGEILKIVKFG